VDKSIPIKVLLVDDNDAFRQTLRSFLQTFPDIHVVGEASDGKEAVLAVEKLKPTVVLTDLNIPTLDGIAATRVIKANHPQIAVIGLSAGVEEYVVYAMIKAGASHVVDKENIFEHLPIAIRRAAASSILVPS
jgi:DNA-binding NarL/FixJ family response regulator